MNELVSIRLLHILPLLISGAWTALQIAVGAFVVAGIGGLLVGTAATFARSRWLKWLISAYGEWLRNVPALAHVFILYFGLPAVGIRLGAMSAAIIGLGMIGTAVLADVFQAGFRSLHVGQSEAALAIGMTPFQNWRYIMLPQVLRNTLGPLSNYAAQLVKDTSIASAIAAPEIMFFARNLVTSTFDTSLIYLAVILIYIVMILPIGAGVLRHERRWRRV
ncbi:polar amino acid transport system permease protein [Herbaspirillum sp. Sphag1AN]|uniref:amino acid ABC transporter permease n=1 Tax=unclassified Herbaspirillum TaxID=2624150 RepID=UPI00161E713C|nr:MULTISPECIES: amino acid ABC transporter permease [unclassified Herbaspirillum]MBB3212756.1 polar amino acid transport system permease protein [Herbaspirillum sp. Sphag1AN]MBB3245953.1 polar amino acid transport system permease protein [Herbaspirillum sp. Sphag64]